MLLRYHILFENLLPISFYFNKSIPDLLIYNLQQISIIVTLNTIINVKITMLKAIFNYYIVQL